MPDLTRLPLLPMIAVLVVCAMPSHSLVAQGELPQAILSSIVIPGITPGDVTFDATTSQVYVVDIGTGDTLVFTQNLVPVTTVPSTFPPGSFVTGITAANGVVFWAVLDTATQVTNLWAALSVGATPANGGPLPLAPGDYAAGIDSDAVNPSALYVSGFPSAVTYVIDPFALAVTSVCLNPFGQSIGISHRAGSFVELNADRLGVGAPTHLTAMNTAGCSALDAVGINIFVPGVFVGGFDYAQATATGGPSIVGIDWNSRTLFRVAGHRSFVRGDADSSGGVTLADATFILTFLFGGGPPPTCLDAADANDDGSVGIGDIAFLTAFATVAGAPPPPPPIATCGHDPTPDPLRCDISGLCP